jgi:hypothetical protein
MGGGSSCVRPQGQEARLLMTGSVRQLSVLHTPQQAHSGCRAPAAWALDMRVRTTFVHALLYCCCCSWAAMDGAKPPHCSRVVVRTHKLTCSDVSVGINAVSVLQHQTRAGSRVRRHGRLPSQRRLPGWHVERATAGLWRSQHATQTCRHWYCIHCMLDRMRSSLLHPAVVQLPQPLQLLPTHPHLEVS